MLKLIIKDGEQYDEENNLFSPINVVELELEHSLLAMSKWESKYKKPFLSSNKKDTKTPEEMIGYLKAMVVTPNVDLDVLYMCSQENIDEIQEYIDSPQSATTFGNMPERRGPGEVITSELIYYWMVAFSIPFECESWHLNRLFALIRICNIKNSKPTKMSRGEIARRNRDLNEQRKKELGTTG